MAIKILDNCINVTMYELHKNVIKIYNSAPKGKQKCFNSIKNEILQCRQLHYKIRTQKYFTTVQANTVKYGINSMESFGVEHGI